MYSNSNLCHVWSLYKLEYHQEALLLCIVRICIYSVHLYQQVYTQKYSKNGVYLKQKLHDMWYKSTEMLYKITRFCTKFCTKSHDFVRTLSGVMQINTYLISKRPFIYQYLLAYQHCSYCKLTTMIRSSVSCIRICIYTMHMHIRIHTRLFQHVCIQALSSLGICIPHTLRS